MKLICKQCGKEFELSQSEIDFYNSKNLHLPKRCKECRQANKNKNGDKAHNYAAPTVNTQNKYRPLSNSNSTRNSKLIYAILIIAIFLAVGGIVLTNIDFTGDYAEITEPIYAGPSYAPEEMQSEPEPVSETAEDDTEASLEAIQSESEYLEDTVQEDSESSAETVQSEPKTSTETEQVDTDDLTSQEQEKVSVTPQYKFRTSALLSEHFEKHGIEMGFATKEEYQAAASAVVTNESALHKIEAEDGDDVYYLEASNEFVIVSTDGFIRTYFKPNDGIEYYNRQ